MLTRKKPETLATILTIKGQGEEIELPVVFRNLSQKEVEGLMEGESRAEKRTLQLLHSWEAEYPLTEEGIIEAEGDRPGIQLALLQGFYQARAVAIKGN